MGQIGLPLASQPLIVQGGLTSREFYRFFQQLQTSIGSDANLGAAVAALQTQVNALESSFNIRGPLSVSVTGSPSSGVIVLSLINDNSAPSPTSFYGTDNAGSKGWQPMLGAFASTANIVASAAADGVVSFNLTTVSNTATPSIQRTSFDSYGRLNGWAAATTDNLPEGSTNLYFTTSRVLATLLTGLSTSDDAAITDLDDILIAAGKLQAKINALSPILSDLLVSSTGLPLVSSTGDFLTTSAA